MGSMSRLRVLRLNMYKPAKILVTGDGGMVGRSLVATLRSGGYTSVLARSSRLLQADIGFAAFCSLISAALALALPPYYPLTQPDSASYTAFANSRTAFYPLLLRALSGAGLDLVQITYVQAVIFHLVLIGLLLAMMRWGIPRVFVAGFAVALGANIGFSSFHWTILTESIFFSVTALAIIFLLDYFRSGRAVHLAATSLCVGILYGIRPAAITFVPMVFFAAWLMWRHRSASGSVLLAALLLPLAFGPVAESLLFKAEHGGNRATVVPYMMIGKAAMIIGPDTQFTGPHANELNLLGTELKSLFGPVHKFLSDIPSAVALPLISSTFEGVAQFSILARELDEAAKRTGASKDDLRNELGTQSIRQNFGSYLRLALLNYAGQWSVTALTFPPAARALNDYVDRYGSVPFRNEISPITLKPSARLSSYLVYVFFLVAGNVSFLLSAVFIVFIIMPSIVTSPRLRYLMLASFFGVMCQIHTIVIALINVPTPRFLMAVFPQILLMLVFAVLAAFPRLASRLPFDNVDCGNGKEADLAQENPAN